MGIAGFYFQPFSWHKSRHNIFQKWIGVNLQSLWIYLSILFNYWKYSWVSQHLWRTQMLLNLFTIYFKLINSPLPSLALVHHICYFSVISPWKQPATNSNDILKNIGDVESWKTNVNWHLIYKVKMFQRIQRSTSSDYLQYILADAQGVYVG